MTERIELLLKSMNLSPSRFADEIDVQRSSVSHILSGRNKPSLDFITKILSTYPQVNPDWLLFNKGGMLRKPEGKAEETTQQNTSKKPDPAVNSPSSFLEKDVPAKDIAIGNEERAQYAAQNVEKIILLYPDGTFKTYRKG